MPEEQRNALMLTARDGLTLSGAADIMGVSTELLRGYRDKAVRKIRHTRAVRKIRSVTVSSARQSFRVQDNAYINRGMGVVTGRTRVSPLPTDGK